MINYDKPILGPQENAIPKKSFEPLFGEFTVEITEVTEPVEVKIPKGRIKLRDENNKIVRGEFVEVDNLEFVRFDVVLTVVEGEHEGRKIWTKLSTHPDYIWLLKGLLHITDNRDTPLGGIAKSLVGHIVKVDVNTVDRTYTKKEVDPETAIEVEVEKTTQKTYVNKYTWA